MKDERDDARDSERSGDVLGISDVTPAPGAAAPRKRRRAKGIEVREPASGIGEMKPGKGATGIDMGAGSDGTDIAPTDIRRTDE